ncbi:hypothetical protein D3C80_2195190 [compost metagenome]
MVIDQFIMVLSVASTAPVFVTYSPPFVTAAVPCKVCETASPWALFRTALLVMLDALTSPASNSVVNTT